jgi:hypothetical protein
MIVCATVAKEDPNFHIKKQQGKVVIEELFPNPKKQKSNYTANRSTFLFLWIRE